MKRCGLGRVWILLAVGVLLTLAATACGGGDEATASVELSGSPESAARDLLAMIDKRQWGPEWDNLHPEQQQFVPRDLFIECSGKDDTPDVESVDVLAVEDDEMLIPGTEVRSASKAVNVKLKLNRGPLNRYEVQDTIQLFDVAGRWRWVLPNIESYKSGNCPD